MLSFGAAIIPTIIVFIIIFGIVKKVPIFDTFLLGAKDGLKSTLSITPALIALIMAVTMLRASGALELFISFVTPLTSAIGIPADVLPLMLLRPVSGSGSIAVLDGIFQNFSPDSFVGRVGSVMMGSTETTFYAIAVYLGSVGINKTKHLIPAALSADIVGYIIAILSVNLFFCS